MTSLLTACNQKGWRRRHGVVSGLYGWIELSGDTGQLAVHWGQDRGKGWGQLGTGRGKEVSKFGALLGWPHM